MRRIAVVAGSALTVGLLASAAGASPLKATPLTARITGPSSSVVGGSVKFSLAKTAVPKGDKITGWSVNYGDGKKVTGKGSEPRTETHVFSRAGTFTVKLTITDARKKTSNASMKLAVKASASTPAPSSTSAPSPTPVVLSSPAAAPVASPGATAAASPASSSVAITSIIDPIAAGSTEQVTATSEAGDSCDLEVVLPSGRQSTASGLGSKTMDASGSAAWSWTITSNTGTGTATATLTCGAGSVARSFTID